MGGRRKEGERGGVRKVMGRSGGKKAYFLAARCLN